MDFQPALRVAPNFQLKLPISAETACRSVERHAFPSENECRPSEDVHLQLMILSSFLHMY